MARAAKPPKGGIKDQEKKDQKTTRVSHFLEGREGINKY